jgi:putative oxidoreductase
VLILAGLALPAAASLLTATMITAIRTVHGKNGPWLTNGGYEYNVVLIAATLALVETGPGRLSLEGRLGRERSGPRWVLAALAAGSLGAFGAHLAASTAPAAAPPSEDETASSSLES